MLLLQSSPPTEQISQRGQRTAHRSLLHQSLYSKEHNSSYSHWNRNLNGTLKSATAPSTEVDSQPCTQPPTCGRTFTYGPAPSREPIICNNSVDACSTEFSSCSRRVFNKRTRSPVVLGYVISMARVDCNAAAPHRLIPKPIFCQALLYPTLHLPVSACQTVRSNFSNLYNQTNDWMFRLQYTRVICSPILGISNNCNPR